MKRLMFYGFLFAMLTTVLFACQKELSYETDQNAGHGTLYDSAFNCRPILSSGTYYNGVSTGNDTNYVKIIVTVTQTGNYSITSDSVNGFVFRQEGYFSKLGIDSILLQAHGTPILNVPTDFVVTLDSSTCGFTINVQDSTGTGLGSGGGGGVIVGDSSFIDPNPATTNTWHFTDSSSQEMYSGVFDLTNTNDPQGGFLSNDTLFIIGQASTTDTTFGIKLVIPGQNIVPGTIYPLTENNILGLQTTTDQFAVYGANGETANAGSANGDSYITITGYQNGQITGSFHVYAVHSNGLLVLIAGSFNTTVR